MLTAQRYWRAPAADGWLVACEGDSQIRALAADGTPVGAFDAAHWPMSTRSKHECSDASVPVWDQEPTLAQATAYYRDSDASATRGVLTPADCGHIEYQAPDGATTILDLTGDDGQRAFTLGDSGAISRTSCPSATTGGSWPSATPCSSTSPPASAWAPPATPPTGPHSSPPHSYSPRPTPTSPRPRPADPRAALTPTTSGHHQHPRPAPGPLPPRGTSRCAPGSSASYPPRRPGQSPVAQRAAVRFLRFFGSS